MIKKVKIRQSLKRRPYVISGEVTLDIELGRSDAFRHVVSGKTVDAAPPGSDAYRKSFSMEIKRLRKLRQQ